MTSVLALEQPGRWRLATITIALLLPLLPAIPLLAEALRSDVPALEASFWLSVQMSVVVATAAATIGWVVGLPLGVAAALYEFPGRKTFLALLALPLLLPSFLWAIGWSSLATRVPALGFIEGVPGCVVVVATTISSLVLLGSLAAMQDLSRSQADAARLAGGETALLFRAARHVLAPSVFAAGLGGVLNLADPGAGQIFGARTAAAAVLTSFAAHYDVGLAARQSVALTMAILTFAVPISALAAPHLTHVALARQSTRGSARNRRAAWGLVATFGIVTSLAVALPIAGLLVPLFGGPWPFLSDAAVLGAVDTMFDTATSTLIYAVGAGLVATSLGFGLAVAAGRSPSVRSTIVAASAALLTWPPAASALGVVTAATASPSWLDPILRSRLTVCVILGLRFFPISVPLALRAWDAAAPSWVHAAAVHGVPFRTYVRRVAWPVLRPSAMASIILVGLLASAEVGTVLLLHPPGEGSLPLAIFTVMANAPESTVAALCLVYLGATFALLYPALSLASREP